MHKISNFTGQARHGWDRMTPFGASRQTSHQPDVQIPPKRVGHATASPGPAPGTIVTLSFNVPFNSALPGPEKDDVIFASPGAFTRWTFPEDAEEPGPSHSLPVHAQNSENLRHMCRQMEASYEGQLRTSVMCAEPKDIPGLQRGPSLVTNVCLSGPHELVQEMRAKILTNTPISLRRATVDIEENLVIDQASKGVRAAVLAHLDEVSKYTKADIFLLHPRQIDEAASTSGVELGIDHRLRCHVYGDAESAEHAKTRILIMIDQILHRHVDVLQLELSMHTLICGRARKNIKMIESQTKTAIYFPPPFPHIYGYHPPGAARRQPDDIIITGETNEAIFQAKKRLHDLVVSTKAYMKEVQVTPSKLDNIILERLDKVRKIIEHNGSYVVLPPLGVRAGFVRVQGTDVLHVERTVREVMSLASQFYKASWWITQTDASTRRPNPSDIQAMLSDICINSGAEISFEELNFHIHGSDEAVKAALMVISNIPFIKKSQYTMGVKIELANEHKEFVSGKKNGKINKIMGHSNVQIVFDGFNEYNFYIDVRGQQYDAIKNGLDLVEQEMPASISFHVPDQYHKRIIGIGGQHIQRIMKKYSVFVKFSNAMDRGGMGKEEEDFKVENVICRTPARNAQNLDLVKAEIMDMVEKADAEFVTETVPIDRLYHRDLLARMDKIEELEKKWNVKINFPSTEQASDNVSIIGPEWQVPQALDDFLGMVPESHELSFSATPDLQAFLRSSEFSNELVEKMKSQYVIDVTLQLKATPAPEQAQPKTQTTEEPEEGEAVTPPEPETLHLAYTRNNAGGLKDAVDFLIAQLVVHGLDALTVAGAIPRPKSDSFEDSLPFFESKLLHNAPAPNGGTDSPTRAAFGDGESSEAQGSFFSKFRKPSSMSSFSSLIDRRKNGTNSPGSLFKHASSNASKASLASLASLESQHSGYRNPWNDSGINLPEEDLNGLTRHPNGSSLSMLGASLTPTSTNTAPGWPVPSAANNAHFEAGKPFPGLSAITSGDTTPTTRYDPRASMASFDSGRPGTSHSFNATIGVGIGPSTSNGSGNGSGNGTPNSNGSNNGSNNGGPGIIGAPR